MTTASADVAARLAESGALLEGHFKLSSGRHSDRYVQCAKLLSRPRWAEEVCAALADKLADTEPDVVVGPAMGGILVAHEVARRLDRPSVFTERVDGDMTLRRGFSIASGARVLVVEDVVTTGGSALEVVALLRELGAKVVGVGSIIQRAAENPFDVRYESLLSVPAESWAPDECPLCAEGGQPVKPGSRPGS